MILFYQLLFIEKHKLHHIALVPTGAQ